MNDGESCGSKRRTQSSDFGVGQRPVERNERGVRRNRIERRPRERRGRDICSLVKELRRRRRHPACRLSGDERSRTVGVRRGPDEAAGWSSRLAGSGGVAARVADGLIAGADDHDSGDELQREGRAALVMRWFGPTGYDVGNNGGSAAAGADGASGEGETLSGVADRLQTVVLSLCAVVAKQSTTPLSQWTEGGDGQCV
jgi:hypothetical protein